MIRDLKSNIDTLSSNLETINVKYMNTNDKPKDEPNNKSFINKSFDFLQSKQFKLPIWLWGMIFIIIIAIFIFIYKTYKVKKKKYSFDF